LNNFEDNNFSTNVVCDQASDNADTMSQKPEFFDILDFDVLEKWEPKIASAIQTLMLVPEAKELLEWASSRQVQIRPVADLDCFGQLWGKGNHNFLEVNSSVSSDLILGTIAHELFHAVQKLNNGLLFSDGYDLRQRIIKEIVTEAAAETASNDIVNSLRKMGIEGPAREVLKLNTAYTDVFSKFVFDYEQKLSVSDHETARDYAKKRSIEHYSKQHAIVISYMGYMLEDFLDYLCEGKFNEALYKVSKNQSLSDKFMKQCFTDWQGQEIAKNLNYNDIIDFIFKGHEDVLEVYAFFEWKIAEQALGQDALDVVALKRDLIEANNPFIDLDVKQIKDYVEKENRRLETMALDEKIKSIANIMHELAGTARGLQRPLDFGDGYPTYSIKDPVSRKARRVMHQAI
tara:strand:- start:205 stop:1413 length:1209 start_codon:yes stop_codon:yes gene_type:complete